MALKYQYQCLVCQAVLADPKLGKRIELSRSFVPGGEGLTEIHKDYEGQFMYKSLANHAKKHQAPNKVKLEKRIKQFKAKEALSEIESVDDKKKVAIYTGQAEARKDILDRAMKALDDGDVKVTMASIVALLGQEQKAEENAKDRGLKMMEMFNYFASGAGNKPDREHVPNES